MPLLSTESRFIHFLELTFDLVVLNLLTLLCCIPVVTVGVAFTALYRSLFDIRKGKANLIKGYFKAFVENFRSGLILGLILILFCVSFALYGFFFRDLITAADTIVVGGIILIAVLFFFPMIFAFPLLSMFDSSAFRTLSNGFLLSMRHAGTTLVVLLMNAFPWILLAINPSWFQKIFPIFLFLSFSLPGWFASALFLKVFKKYSKK